MYLPFPQKVEVIDPQARDNRLLELLQQHHKSRKNRIIIFVLYKKEAPRCVAVVSLLPGSRRPALHSRMCA